METNTRPWGHFDILDSGEGWQLKKLVIHPNQSTSLQYHEHRQEHWMFVQGSGYVMAGEDGNSRGNVGIGAVHTVPQLSPHRIVNNGEIDLIVIELQRGDPISEDDIVRLEDQYGRVTTP